MNQILSHYMHITNRNERGMVTHDFYVDLPGNRRMLRTLRLLKDKINFKSEKARREETRTLKPATQIFSLYSHDPMIQYYGLIMAIMNGNLQMLKHYLDSGVRPYGPGYRRCGVPLLIALATCPDAARLFIEYGAMDEFERYDVMIGRHFLRLARPDVLDTIIDLAEDKVNNLPEYQSVKRRIFNEVPASPPSSDPELKKAQHFRELLSQPRSLFSLSRQVVCRNLGAMPGRRSKVQQLPLPNLVKQNLCVEDVDLKFAQHDEGVSFHMYESYVFVMATRVLGFELHI